MDGVICDGSYLQRKMVQIKLKMVMLRLFIYMHNAILVNYYTLLTTNNNYA